MSKIALITDTHWGCRGDSLVFHEYFSKFYNEIFFPYILKNDIKTIIHLGDIVDRRKFINFVTLNKFRKNFLSPVIDNNIDCHFIIGNHDVPYRNSNDINSMSELLGPMYSDRRVHYYSEPTVLVLDGVQIALLPWINNSNYNESVEFCKETKAQILFGHLEINGFEMYRGLRSEDGISPETLSLDKFDIVCSGHFHHKSTKNNINYLGTPYEITWHDYNDNRGFHIFDTATRELEFIRNPLKMFHKFWYDDKDKSFEEIMDVDFLEYQGTCVKVIVQSKTNPYAFDLIMDRIYKSDPFNVSIVDDNHNMDVLTEEDIVHEAEDTLSILSKYIDHINTSANKNELKKLFSSLYNEAHETAV